MACTASVLGLVLLFDMLSTAANSQDVVMLICDWNPAKIQHLSFADKKIQSLAISNITQPVAIDYDAASSTVYWTDIYWKQIRATRLNVLSDSVVISLGPGSIPDGLALDSTLQKLFYTDAGRNKVAVVNVNGTDHKDLVTSGLEKPRAIVLDQRNRKFYFTEWGTRPFIAVANYDGTGFRTIYTTNLVWPNGLALDKTTNMLFWCDAKTHKIETGSITGTSRKVLLYEENAHYFDIFLFGNALFFTDWNRQKIMSLPKTGGSVGFLSSSVIGKLAGLHVFSTVPLPECPSGQFGTPCRSCGHCLSNSVCENLLGSCLAGCNPGYVGDKCNEKCPEETYGAKCTNSCGKCKDGTCDHVTGNCLGGCDPGYQMPSCSTRTGCGLNQYGVSCAPCGYCNGGQSCDQITGQCPFDCQEGWSGPLCRTSDKEEGLPIGLIVGATLGGLVILMTGCIILAYVLVRRKKEERSNRSRVNIYADMNRQNCDIYTMPSPPPYSSIGDVSGHNNEYASLDEVRPADYAQPVSKTGND